MDRRRVIREAAPIFMELVGQAARSVMDRVLDLDAVRALAKDSDRDQSALSRELGTAFELVKDLYEKNAQLTQRIHELEARVEVLELEAS